VRFMCIVSRVFDVGFLYVSASGVPSVRVCLPVIFRTTVCGCLCLLVWLYSIVLFPVCPCRVFFVSMYGFLCAREWFTVYPCLVFRVSVCGYLCHYC